MGRSRYRFIDVTQPHCMTCTVLHRIPVFTRHDTVEILLDSLRYLANDGLTIHAYVILEDHLHLIAQSADLSRDICRFKSYTAKQLLAHLHEQQLDTVLDQFAYYKKASKTDREHQFWEDGVHPEWIADDDAMHEKIESLHNNPVKRGYVDEPAHWRYSSARSYLGQKGLVQICTA